LIIPSSSRSNFILTKVVAAEIVHPRCCCSRYYAAVVEVRLEAAELDHVVGVVDLKALERNYCFQELGFGLKKILAFLAVNFEEPC
jgi:hypothetical protein